MLEAYDKDRDCTTNLGYIYQAQYVYSKKSIKYKYTVSDILNNNENVNRYFVSHHLTNLRINNFPIDIFIKKYSKNIFVYNSGAIKKYLPGPISQNLIFNAITK